MNYTEVIKYLEKMSNANIVEYKRNHGSTAKNSYGIMVKDLRAFAKKNGIDHHLALELFASGIHEARKLACMIADPTKLTEIQMEEWATEFDSWDICDCCCSSLFVKTKFAFQKALEWSTRKEEYVKRAAFTMMAHLVFHNKSAQDDKFEQFFPIIKKESNDNRNFVKKAINWALRQIGKRNIRLNLKAISVAQEISQIDSKSARWIASHALRELTGKKINILGYPKE